MHYMRSHYMRSHEQARAAVHKGRGMLARGWRYARKHKLKTFFWLLGGFLVFMGVFLLWAATLPLPDLEALSQIRIDQSVKLYDRTGQVLLYDLSNKDVQRTSVALTAISPNIQN